ncbi:MAG TPA: prolyl oligopeptidase family serine peptidase [Iamia sp.]
MSSSFPPVPDPPPTPADGPVEVLLGHRVADPFRALEDGDTDVVRAWDDAQSARTAEVLSALPGREALRDRLRELLDVPVVLAVAVAGDVVVTLERADGRDQATLVVAAADSDGTDRRELVDPRTVEDDDTAAIDWFHPSPDGTLVAVGTSTGGDELSTLRVVSVADGAWLPDAIDRTRAASVAWRADSSGFVYTRYPDPDAVPEGEAGYHRTVLEHDLGADPADDAIVWDDLPDPTAWAEVRLSRDDRWLLVHASLGWDRTDVHLCDRRAGTWTTIIEGVDALTDLRVVGDLLVGTTTLDAPTGRVVAAPLDHPHPDGWVDVLAAGDAVIEGLAVTSETLLVARSRAAVSELVRLPRPTALPTAPAGAEPVPLPTEGSLVGLSASRDRDEAYVGFTSFALPPATFRWTGSDGPAPWATRATGIDAGAFAVDRLRYPSTDGTEITLFCLRRADVEPSPTTPTILTGYGGFGITMSPAYSPDAVTHAEGGGVWAVACIRGGAEEGEEWHRAGQRARKPQVFADFEAAADQLVRMGRTSRDHLVIRGGSNGGLLVTAALTRRPDLCAAVHSAVPLCDMVRFPRFRIARLWVPEYGDPDQPEDLAWLLSYSPYHHVVDGTRYPAVLITTGAEDSRVDPLHARKMAARLQQAAPADAAPVLLRVERGAGHGQGKPSSRRAEEGADVLAFLHAAISNSGE